MYAKGIRHLWFDQLTDRQHFANNAALDEMIRSRFGATPDYAAQLEALGEVWVTSDPN